jgi:hypothetical protein
VIAGALCTERWLRTALPQWQLAAGAAFVSAAAAGGIAVVAARPHDAERGAARRIFALASIVLGVALLWVLLTLYALWRRG